MPTGHKSTSNDRVLIPRSLPYRSSRKARKKRGGPEVVMYSNTPTPESAWTRSPSPSAANTRASCFVARSRSSSSLTGRGQSPSQRPSMSTSSLTGTISPSWSAMPQPNRVSYGMTTARSSMAEASSSMRRRVNLVGSSCSSDGTLPLPFQNRQLPCPPKLCGIRCM